MLATTSLRTLTTSTLITGFLTSCTGSTATQDLSVQYTHLGSRQELWRKPSPTKTKVKKTKMIKQRNFVAKNAKTCGAGQHKVKRGKFATRARQKHNAQRGIE